MKTKAWVKYLISILLIFGLVALDGYILKQAIYFKETPNLGINYFTISMIIKILTGFVLGLEHIIKEIKKEGSWKANLPKIIFMVIPSLYFFLVLFFMDLTRH